MDHLTDLAQRIEGVNKAAAELQEAYSAAEAETVAAMRGLLADAGILDKFQALEQARSQTLSAAQEKMAGLNAEREKYRAAASYLSEQAESAPLGGGVGDPETPVNGSHVDVAAG